MTATSGAFDVNVRVHLEEGTWWAEAGEMPGWTAAASSQDELRGLIEEGIAFFFRQQKSYSIFWPMVRGEGVNGE